MDGSIRVLHVDDEPDISELTATYLEQLDDRFVVETVRSASNARERLGDGEFDCVVSDYDMPGENGIKFLESVRTRYPDLPFILFTGKGSEAVASDAISAGVTDYLQKQTGTEQYELLANRIFTAVGQYRAEHELERQSDLFSKTQDLANVGAWEWYPQREEGYYSEQVYEIYGVDSREDRSPAADLRRFYHPSDREDVREAFRRAIKEGERYDVEARITDANGTDKWIRTRGDPQFEDGECIRVRGTIRDITDRKRREQALEELNEATREFIDAADKESVAESAVETARSALDMEISGLWLYDEDAAVLRPVAHTETAEKHLRELPTYTGEESLSWRAFDRGEMEVVEDISGDDQLYNPDTALNSEIIVPLGDHGVMNLATTGEPGFTDTDVSLAQILANSVEAALSSVDREQRLRRKREEVNEQNERLSEFVGVVSHDLRTPLTVADGHLELAPDDDHVAAARDAIDRGEELIEDLLTLARQAEVDETEPVSLSSLSDRCWETVDGENATLTVDSTRLIRADRRQLQQLLENLLRNAITHGGRDVTIRVGEVENGFYVEDDGPGIPEERRSDVFEAGYSTAEAGTGFGLRIVEQVADAHDWNIRLTEGTDGGARFELTGVTVAE